MQTAGLPGLRELRVLRRLRGRSDYEGLPKSPGLSWLQQLPGCCTTAEAAGLKRRPRCASCEGCTGDCKAEQAVPAVTLRGTRATWEGEWGQAAAGDRLSLLLSCQTVRGARGAAAAGCRGAARLPPF